MKLAIRIFALSVVIAGACAASLSSSTTPQIASHQGANGSDPVPWCIPNSPDCPPAASGQ